MDQQSVQKFIDEMWDDSIVPELVEYIKIPAKSPAFDPEWDRHGYIEDATQQIFAWCESQDVKGMECEIVRLPGRTPLIFMEIPGSGDDVFLEDSDVSVLYGLDQSSVSLASLNIAANYTGELGLPRVNAEGSTEYVEYRDQCASHSQVRTEFYRV